MKGVASISSNNGFNNECHISLRKGIHILNDESLS